MEQRLLGSQLSTLRLVWAVRFGTLNAGVETVWIGDNFASCFCCWNFKGVFSFCLAFFADGEEQFGDDSFFEEGKVFSRPLSLVCEP